MRIRDRIRPNSNNRTQASATPVRVLRAFDPKVEQVPLDRLIPAHRNARTHSKKQIRQLAAGITEFGVINPILVDNNLRIIAGHGRVAAAKILGLDKVPIIRIGHLTPEQIRAYALADNRLAELAGWDPELLALELGELSALEIDFPLEITGFSSPEIDHYITILDPDDPPSDDDVAPDPLPTPVSVPGDLWLLGRHRLLCGDVRDPNDVTRVLDGALAQMVFTDPPYNVAIDGHVCGLGRVHHRDFAMASGEMNAAEFTAFLTTVLGNLAAASVDGAIHFVCMDWRHIGELLAAGRVAYSELKNLCVWNKDNAGMGTFYRSKHELVFVFKNGTAKHINTFGLGETGRYRTNVWDYPGINSLTSERAEELAMHPTVKPVALVMDAIKDCSLRGGLILDGFGGSGTTLIAAEKTRRRAALLEIDPSYVDVTIRRWEKLTGELARHAETGRTFAEVMEMREVRHG